MACIKINCCSFYNHKNSIEHGIGLIFKKKYCNDNYELCARYKVMKEVGEEYVPANLYPNMMDLAVGIIEKAKKNKNSTAL